MRLLVLLALVIGCEKTAAKKSDPISESEARTFVEKFQTAMKPCDKDAVAALVDGDAIAQHIDEAAKSSAAKIGAARFRDANEISKILCAWQDGVESYHLLHLTMKDGAPRIVMRRIGRSPRSSVATVGYEQLLLEKHGKDVKLGDLYSFTQGSKLSDLLAGGMDAITNDGVSSTFDTSEKLKESRALQKQGKFAEALAIVDGLPKEARNSRMVQMARLRIADQLSPEAYKQALDEIAHLFPGDPSVALVDVDGALLRGDYAQALKDIDTIDAAIGGDAFQNAIRAAVLRKRNGPGDLEKAAALAESAITAEPNLAKGWWSRLDIAVERKQYQLAVDTMSQLEQRFGAKFDETKLRALPDYGAFLDSPEYTAWRGSAD